MRMRDYNRPSILFHGRDQPLSLTPTASGLTPWARVPGAGAREQQIGRWANRVSSWNTLVALAMHRSRTAYPEFNRNRAPVTDRSSHQQSLSLSKRALLLGRNSLEKIIVTTIAACCIPR